MPEKLNQLQIQLLLYFLEAEPKRRTVTGAAKHFKKTKSSITRALDHLEKLDFVERIESRKSALTLPGINLAKKYRQQLDVIEKFMLYQEVPLSQIKENALRMLAAGLSDAFMERLEEREKRMRLKEIFAGRQNIPGSELCDHLKDGSYFFPFVLYREHIKNHHNISMGNRGFEHLCELIVNNHEGMVYLTLKTMCAQSAQTGQVMEGRMNERQYLLNGEFHDAGRDGRYVYFPITALQFITVGKGRNSILHGSACLRMQCSVGELPMPRSTAVFTLFIA